MKIPFVSQLDHHMAEVVRGAAVAFVLKVIGAALTFGLNVLIARFFGAEGTGVFALAFTVMTIATVFGRMGMDNSLLRFVAGNAAGGNWTSVKGVYRTGLGIALVASLAAMIMLLLLAPLLAHLFRKHELTGPIRWMALAVPPMTLLTLLASVLQGLKRIFASTLASAVTVPAVTLLVLWLLGPGLGPTGAIWAYTVGAVVSASAGWWWWTRATSRLKQVRGEFSRRVLLASSIPLLWVASMSMAMNWIATFALGVWATTADVGVFNAASRVTFLVSFVLIAVNTISAPKFAALYDTGELEVLASTARMSARLMALIAAPVLVVFLAIPRFIMGIFGPEFEKGAAVLAILAVAQAANVLAGSVGYLLMMSGHERQVRNSNFISAMACLVGSVVLVPGLGGLGAAIAVAIALVVRNIVEINMVRRHLGIGALFLAPRAHETVQRH